MSRGVIGRGNLDIGWVVIGRLPYNDDASATFVFGRVYFYPITGLLCNIKEYSRGSSPLQSSSTSFKCDHLKVIDLLGTIPMQSVLNGCSFSCMRQVQKSSETDVEIRDSVICWTMLVIACPPKD